MRMSEQKRLLAAADKKPGFAKTCGLEMTPQLERFAIMVRDECIAQVTGMMGAYGPDSMVKNATPESVLRDIVSRLSRV